MQRARRLTPAERCLAIQRLRTTTLAVTFASIAGTLGFGWVAALSNPGTQANAASQSSTTTTDTGTGSADSSTDSSSTDDQANDSSLQSSGSIGSSSSGSAHATSGGS
jgi:hypothetical protein